MPEGTPPRRQPPGSPGLATLIEGWQQYFEILWRVTRQDGHALVGGYITNAWGYPAEEVRVLVRGYDASGRQAGQLIAWGPNEIEPGDRVYFDVTVPAGVATYDVSIFSGSGGGAPGDGPREASAAACARLDAQGATRRSQHGCWHQA